MFQVTRHTDIWLARHAETDWNRARRYQSRSDRPLSAFGQARTAAVRQRLRRIRFEVVVSSGLRRCDDLAAAIAADQRHPAQLIQDERWQEADHGAWEGMTYAEVLQRYAQQAQQRFADPWRSRAHGGESLSDLWERLEQGWDELLEAYSGAHILIVSHATPIQLLLCALLGTPFERYWQFRVDLGSLSNLDLYPSGAIVRNLNLLAWRSE